MPGKHHALSLTRLLLQCLPLVLINPAAALTTGGSLQFTQWQSSAFDDGGAANDIERREIAANFNWQRGHTTHSLGYAHQPLLIRSGAPASNGYLHQLDWQLRKQTEHYEGEIRAGVHGSSNMFKHTDFHRDALVASFQGYRPLQNTAVSPGIAGDYRFGRFQVYPMLRLLAPLRNSFIEIELPVSLQWRDADQRWRVGLERYGEKWGTLDADRQVEDKLYLSEWRFGGSVQIPGSWSFGTLELGAGISFASKVRYRDLEQGRRREKLEDSVYASLAWRW